MRVRQETVEQTRLRITEATVRLHERVGPAATTVSAIADRAGTSLQTLYLAWGSKTALFRAAADATTTASGLPLSSDSWRERIEQSLHASPEASASAEAYLQEVAKVFTRVASRSIVYWRMQPAAAAADPDIAAGYETAMHERRITMQHVAARIPNSGLRPNLDPDFVADTLWALASPETYSLLTGSRGYTNQAYQRWLGTTLTATLCG